ncbi:class I SAM-dependent methyltransferase [Phormidium sp. CCY1219]|uniref:class I SAM-dependent methyltransferase n=1 Tax=Phormidium sp. CCY1219 TaxID=2886104 RepID=UPI002D1F18E0|nr:class I SAM-dependent methyltransferase [Phormidium sp. CCY1219]MEB3829522.1 class I SAM-dependent methyltransferase [Phormidium sp. CCY1219]
MDYQRFIDKLTDLYENWGEESVRPKTEKFQKALDRVQGMTTPNVMQLLNCAVSCMEAEELYCEIGTYQGSSLIGALLDNGDRKAYAVDNFSELDEASDSLSNLLENLKKFNLENRVSFYNQDFEKFLLELREVKLRPKIGTYFYDCAYDYRSQLMGLLLIRHCLSDRALIIVNNSNWKSVQQAQSDFVAAHPECEILQLSPSITAEPSFGNGIQLLSWDIARREEFSADSILANPMSVAKAM